MTSYLTWAAKYPQAAAELEQVTGIAAPMQAAAAVTSEGRAMQEASLSIAQQGAYGWRNNVGATPAKCKGCGLPGRPVRYGLCNDSHALNEKFKSSDLILAIPRIIKPADVGQTIAQFGSVEVKPGGWTYSGAGRETAQANWLNLIESIGGYARFTTGAIEL